MKVFNQSRIIAVSQSYHFQVHLGQRHMTETGSATCLDFLGFPSIAVLGHYIPAKLPGPKPILILEWQLGTFLMTTRFGKWLTSVTTHPLHTRPETSRISFGCNNSERIVVLCNSSRPSHEKCIPAQCNNLSGLWGHPRRDRNRPLAVVTFRRRRRLHPTSACPNIPKD